MKITYFKYPKRGIKIEAGLGGTLEADNVLIRIFASKLKEEGEVTKTDEFNDRLDKKLFLIIL